MKFQADFVGCVCFAASIPQAASLSRIELNRRVFITTAGGVATLTSVPPVMAEERQDVKYLSLEVDGKYKTFPAQVLPRNYDKGLQLPIKDITSEVFGAAPEYEEAWPYTADDFKRIDETDDGSFYDSPRLVYHIDPGAVAALSHYYATTIKPGSDILDICSSWVSHYPTNFPDIMGKIAGTGMNGLELQANKQLTGGFVASDLNKKTVLPFPDKSFDVVTCVVSVDYLIHPLAVFREVSRVLKPGGKFVISQSNRLFYTKAIRRWLGLGDLDRLEFIGDYFHYSGSGFGTPRAFDISAKGNKYAKDPMYIVEATKS